jgi:pimeloyl-ACP methyl ester carboxylesterase
MTRAEFRAARSKPRLKIGAADVNSDDAARLLQTASNGPAYVFANSGGAQIGLDLAARHPEVVRILIAHEPPCVELLPEAAQKRVATREVYEIYLRDGAGPAMQKFFALAGFEVNREPPRDPEVMMRMDRNIELFIKHGVSQISGFTPDIARLRAGPVRVVVAIGTASAGQLAHQSALALAQRLGTVPERFPGGHVGFMSDATEFAGKLHAVLSG